MNKFTLKKLIYNYYNYLNINNMTTKCTCINIAFAPKCNYCNTKFYKYLDDRDTEIIKIREKNLNENKCECKYFMQTCYYTCKNCDDDFSHWIDNYDYYLNKKNMTYCTCFDSYKCYYCRNKYYKYLNERDSEIIKIREKNLNENKCKCKYFHKICFYTCKNCNNDIKCWIKNHDYNLNKNVTTTNNNHLNINNMTTKCTCSDLPFAPQCYYCSKKFFEYLDERDIEIIKIREKNLNENKCKCKYFHKICFYTCNNCDDDLSHWIKNHDYNLNKNVMIINDIII